MKKTSYNYSNVTLSFTYIPLIFILFISINVIYVLAMKINK